MVGVNLPRLGPLDDALPLICRLGTEDPIPLLPGQAPNPPPDLIGSGVGVPQRLPDPVREFVSRDAGGLLANDVRNQNLASSAADLFRIKLFPAPLTPSHGSVIVIRSILANESCHITPIAIFPIIWQSSFEG